MAKAKKRKTTRNKKTQKQSVNWTENRLFRLSVLLFTIAICIISLFRFGLIGSFFFQLLNYVFGMLAYVLLLGII
ncbi:MAG: hypothetical protein J6D18_04020, partial [Erysipelotrichaceae bacterium]|nr:hypothetical protein [Erysipelotrichaceae bacterium]